MRVAIYGRKSVYTGKGESVENQITLCREYLLEKVPSAKNAEILVYEDEGFSGKSMARPQFQKMMADSIKEKPDYIICYRLDRISRSVSDFAPFIEELLNRGISFISVKEQFDTTNPMSKAMMYIASVFAQLERETIAERVRDNMLLLARTGRWLGGTAPTGFTASREETLTPQGKRKSVCYLESNPRETGAVQTIFSSFLNMQSLSGVLRRLRAVGITSRLNKPYSLISLRDILQNPVYCAADSAARDYFLKAGSDVAFQADECTPSCGLLAYRKRSYAQNSAVRQNKSEWVIAVGRHAPLLTGSRWIEVQTLLEAGRSFAAAGCRTPNSYALLSGLLRCKKCGSRMFAKPRSQGGGQFDYICAEKQQGTSALCDCQNLGGKAADQRICAFLMPLLSLTGEKLLPELSSLIAGLRRAKRTEPAAQTSCPEQIACFLESAKTVQALFLSADLYEKRGLIKALVQKIEWSQGCATIFFKSDEKEAAHVAIAMEAHSPPSSHLSPSSSAAR